MDDPLGEHWRRDLAAWRHAKTPAAKRSLGKILVDAAMRADKPDLVEAVAAGGERALREGEIRLPRRPAKRVTLTGLQTLPGLHRPNPREQVEGGNWLTRRITYDNFEVWSPTHGWLFGREGELLNEAKPPRRDGVGREWFGAFIPDGRWITTDLWEFDRVLTFFSREGKWLKEIPGATLVPLTGKEKEEPYPPIGADFLITWARSDKEGRGWIVQVGADGGRGRVWIGPDGPAEPLPEQEGYGWTRCYPRQLGPRGGFYWQIVPSDSGKVTLGFHVMSHGTECSYPQYFTGDDPDNGATVRFPGGEWNYGFWPGSTDFFVVAGHPVRPTNGDVQESATWPTEERTWFFNRDADFLGWIRAERLADGSDGRTMLFRTKDNRIVTLDRHQRVLRVQRFVLPANAGNVAVHNAVPLELFADLHLGLFADGDRIVLARWSD